MSLSQVHANDIACEHCGVPSTRPLWAVIDGIERPDLVAQAAVGELSELHCDGCGAVRKRVEPLILCRVSNVAPIVLAASDHVVSTAEVPADAEACLTTLRIGLGLHLQEVPGPLLIVHLDIVPAIAARNVERDLRDTDAAFRQVARAAGEAVGQHYLEFLTTVQQTASDRQARLALGLLSRVTTADELRKFVSDFPEFFSPDTARRVDGWMRHSEHEAERLRHALGTRVIELVSEGDLDRAVDAISSYLERITDVTYKQMRTDLDAAAAAMETEDFLAAAQPARSAHEVARVLGVKPFEAEAAYYLATALGSQGGMQQLARIEESIQLYRRVLVLIGEGKDPESQKKRADVLLNLTAAYGLRLAGDPQENALLAIACGREALAATSLEETPDRWAMANTNLGLCLLQGKRTQADVQEAIGRLNDALRWRSRERHAGDWAFTQLNLGVAYVNLAPRLLSEWELAIVHFENAAEGFMAAGDRLHAAEAATNIGNARLELARNVTGRARRSELDDAERWLRLALEHHSDGLDQLALGRTLTILGDVFAECGRTAAAVKALEQALALLSPHAWPAESLKTAQKLGALAARLGLWETAARGYDAAVDASVLAYDMRADAEGRSEEVRASAGLPLSAAYALCRAGRPQRAVEVLEAGRARELGGAVRREEVDLSRLAQIDPDLHGQFVDARAQLRLRRTDRASPVMFLRAGGLDSRPVPRAVFQEVVNTIREIPGLTRFLGEPSINEVLELASPHTPFVYILSIPHGSLALIVWGASDQEPGDHAMLEVVYAEPPLTSRALPTSGRSGDLSLAPAYAEESAAIAAAVEQTQPVLGESLLRPLMERLRTRAPTGITLIPAGTLGYLPLHAIVWSEGGRDVDLLQEVEVGYAISALTHGVCEERARTRSAREAVLYAVGNPLPHPKPLAGAEAEVRTIATRFEKAQLCLGPDATKQAVLRGLTSATCVHLACHGRATIWWPFESALSLASGEELTLREVIDEALLENQLVVASACDTAVYGVDEPDEVFGLAAGFLVAGAAGVIATLAEVDDFATALLMARLYELLIDTDGVVTRELTTPRAALRAAQLWLRHLSEADEAEYLTAHPDLEARMAARMHMDNVPGERGSRANWAHRPYSKGAYWAPFVAYGS